MPNWTYSRTDDSASSDDKLQVDNSGNIYFRDGSSGTFKSVDSTGTERWVNSDVKGDGTDIDYFAVTPDGSEVIILFNADSWYFLDGTTGSVNTTTSTTFEGSVGMVTVGNTREVYTHEWTTSGTRRLYHYDAGNDTSLKSFAPNDDPRESDEVSFNTDYIYFGDASNYVYKLARSDFSVVQSKQLDTRYGATITTVADDNSLIVVEWTDFDTDDNTNYHRGIDGSLNELWEEELTLLGSSYDNADNEYYLADLYDDGVRRVNDEGLVSHRWDTSTYDVREVDINDDWSSTKSYVQGYNGTIIQLDDTNDFYSVLSRVTATQVSTSDTTNATSTLDLWLADATQVSTSTTTNTSKTLDGLAATQPPVEVWLNSPSIEIEEPAWSFVDNNGQQYIANAVDISGGEPQITRGERVTLPFVFFKDNEEEGTRHTETYQRLIDTYKQNLTEDTIKTINTGRGVPRFTENINPQSSAETYLFKLNSDDNYTYQKEWWVVVTDIEDATTLRGPREQLNITIYPLEPFDGSKTRAEIVDEYKV